MKRFRPILLGASAFAVAVAVVVIDRSRTVDQPPSNAREVENETAAPLESPTPREISLADAGIERSAMDGSVDPCFDFYRFACGGWSDRQSTPDDSSMAFDALRTRNREIVREILAEAAAHPTGDPQTERVGNFFAACMDERAKETAGTVAVRPFLELIAAAEDKAGIRRAAARLHQINVPAFFTITSVNDPDDWRQVIAVVWNQEIAAKLRQFSPPDDPARMRILEDLFHAVGLPREEAKEGARIRRTIYELGAKPAGRGKRYDRELLRASTSHFGWDEFLADIGHAEWDPLFVLPADYLTDVDSIIAREPVTSLRSYLRAELLLSLGPDLSTNKLVNRAEWCTYHVGELLGDDLGALYVGARFNDNRRLIAWGMAGSIAETLKERLRAAAWLDDPSRSGTEARIKDLALLIGFPNQPDQYALTPKREAWLTTLIEARFEAASRNFRRIGKPADRWRWRVPASTVNAFYTPLENALVFPAGILVEPFFDISHPSAVNYGAIGSVMGHELTHGVVAYNGKFNVYGTDGDRWTKETHEAFAGVKKCLASQYSQIDASRRTEQERTLFEDVADVGGTQVAWDAWSSTRAKDRTPPVVAEGFNEEQLFFLAYAQIFCEKRKAYDERDNHSPGRVRVIGALSNSTAFGAAFSCSRGTPMQPEHSCPIW